MSDPPTDGEVETALRDFFYSPEAAPKAVRDGAKALFDLRRASDVLAEWTNDDLVAVREGWGSDESDSMITHLGPDLRISIAVSRRRLDGSVVPIPDAITVENAGGDGLPVQIDEAGGFSVTVVGAVRLRIRRSGTPDAVTDMVIVPA